MTGLSPWHRTLRGMAVGARRCGRRPRRRDTEPARCRAGPRSARAASATRSPSAWLRRPLAGRLLIWTRLAPDPLADDGMGGMPPRVHEAAWEIADDGGFGAVVRRGTAPARPASRFYNNRRGYVRTRFTAQEMRATSRCCPTSPSPARRCRPAPRSWCPTGNRVSTASDSRSGHAIILPQDGNRPAGLARPRSRDAGPRRGYRPLSECGDGCSRTPAVL